MRDDQHTARVRRAVEADAPAIAALNAELCMAQGDPPSQFTADAVLRDGFGEQPEFEVLVAERCGHVIGYALFTTAYEPGFAARGLYLSDLCVTGAARRSGVGRALLDAVTAEADRRGRTYVWWLSVPRNTGAQAFYKALTADIEAPVISRVRLVPPRAAHDATVGVPVETTPAPRSDP